MKQSVMEMESCLTCGPTLHTIQTLSGEDCSFPPAIPGSALYQVAKHTAAAAQRYKGQIPLALSAHAKAPNT